MEPFNLDTMHSIIVFIDFPANVTRTIVKPPTYMRLEFRSNENIKKKEKKRVNKLLFYLSVGKGARGRDRGPFPGFGNPSLRHRPYSCSKAVCPSLCFGDRSSTKILSSFYLDNEGKPQK